MELFADAAKVAESQQALASLKGPARLPVLLEVAWHLRQSEMANALKLADEAELLIGQCMLRPDEQRISTGRLHLIRSEAKWLGADLDWAEVMAGQALQIFEEVQDARGLADANWLLGCIATDRGDVAMRNLCYQAVIEQSRSVDAVRVGVAEGALARAAVQLDVRDAQKVWADHFDVDAASNHPASAAWSHDYFGTVAYQANDFDRAVSHWTQAFEMALQTGQLRRAIAATNKIGNAYSNMSELEISLEWNQRGLELARPTGWPYSVGLCLLRTGDTLRQMGRLDAAEDLLKEALMILSPMSESRSYAVALTYLADLALARGEPQNALKNFLLLEQRGRALEQVDFIIEGARGQAHALSDLGRPGQALPAALEALAVAEQSNSFRQIRTLEVLAEIHSRHALPPPPGVASAPLHYLQRALAVAATLEGYTVTGELLDALASAYAKAGDHAQAYATSLQANAARTRAQTRQAHNRAAALQIKYQTQRAEIAGEHHRQLAAAEAARAEVLQQTTDTLERLSVIGQEITAHLDAAAVFEALSRHVNALLDAPFCAVYLVDQEQQSLQFAFEMEEGRSLPGHHVPLSDPTSGAAQCMREQREILVEGLPGQLHANLISGTRPALTRLYVPLVVNERTLGVMSIQSWRAYAYGARERMIFRTLCAYGAIALDNAAAYRQLEATLKILRTSQAQVVEKNIELEESYRTLEKLSLTDPLTGLHNRRFLSHIEGDIALSLRRYEAALAAGSTPRSNDADVVFFLLDFDQFKAVNDLYGHAAGDMVLVQMADRLRHLFRESDFLIRWGGEEFLIVARATNRADAEIVAERVRVAVAEVPFQLADGTLLSKSCSIGFASYPFFQQQPRLLSWPQVLELADQSLYRAKNGGRNQWNGMCGVNCSQPDDVFQRLLREPDQAAQSGEVRLVRSVH